VPLDDDAAKGEIEESDIPTKQIVDSQNSQFDENEVEL